MSNDFSLKFHFNDLPLATVYVLSYAVTPVNLCKKNTKRWKIFHDLSFSPFQLFIFCPVERKIFSIFMYFFINAVHVGI
jgi:hypothetical protein